MPITQLNITFGGIYGVHPDHNLWQFYYLHQGFYGLSKLPNHVAQLVPLGELLDVK